MSQRFEPGTDPFADFDAAYVLGALSPEDRSAFEEHMTTCDACADSVRLLAGVPGLLAQVDAHQVSAEPAPSDQLSKLATEVQRTRRRRLLATAAAAAAGLLICLALVLATPLTEHPVGAEMTALGAYPVHANINLSDVPTGTRVDMSCRYEGSRGGDYVLVAVQRDGRTADLATWYAMPKDTAELAMTTPLRRAEIQSLELRVPGGPTLLRLAVNK
ncbi:zf-HC2 domain-containing protein [Saccharopolyspora sp. K220]|uniref:anti-sigma factor family protein n=1 Tax=Saccharopolyspora soli TaxID=2926618 RepID=UPI001F56C273|nr:zf-HC2 domain-containing protein [Saccharopolyspora soli]MCI2422404.1 zf-HC2 domain-containing protein [Saccharopolyspora soli]